MALSPLGCDDGGLQVREPRLQAEIIETEEYTYTTVDADSRTAVLGEVPVYSAKKALFELSNPTSSTLIVDTMEAVDSSGRRWSFRLMGARDGVDGLEAIAQDQPWPKKLDAFETFQVEVTYSPLEIGNQDAYTLGIISNAANGNDNDTYDLNVEGVGGEPLGAPDIAIEYNGQEVGPLPEDCATEFDSDGEPIVETDADGNPIINRCRIPQERALDLGNIQLGQVGNANVTIKNTAQCPPFPNAEPCTSCALLLAPNPDAEDVGVGFKPGSNMEGHFGFGSSVTTPVEIRQRSFQQCEDGGAECQCEEDGQISFTLTYSAPETEAQSEATLVIESNDPDEPVVEIPIQAAARNAPVAIASFREFDPENPSQPYTDPSDIEPLQRVYLDGCESYDPRDPEDPSLITDYEWEIIAPNDANAEDFNEEGVGTCNFSFEVPLAGEYTVKLTVRNDVGIASGDTQQSRVEFTAVPGSRLHVQLVWDHPTNDQDLHLTFVNEEDLLCSAPYDCYFGNETPVWFDQDPEAEGANPRLDRDDTDGLGPENINIDDPRPGTYRIYAQYYPGFTSEDDTPTRLTVRVWLNGIQRAEYKRTLLARGQVWAVGDIVWPQSGEPSVQPYPADVEGQTGAVATMESGGCAAGGWQFPAP